MGTRVDLQAALWNATVALTVPAGPQENVGSGVFVAPGLIVTCAHVITDRDGTPTAGRASGTWRGRTFPLEIVKDWIRPWAAGAGPDLALLRANTVDQPWVELCDLAEIGDDVWAYGYPQGHYRDGDSVAFRYEGPSQAPGTQLHKLAQGQAMPGMSGAPVLNWRTGGIIGIVRASRDSSTDLGARLVPAASITAEFGDAITAARGTTTDSSWLALLTDDQLRAGRWPRPSRQIREYLAAMAKHARDYPYAMPFDSAPPLIDLYVQQKAARRTDTATQDKERGKDKQHEHHRRTDAIPVSAVLVHRNAVLVGDPGAGKSTFVNYVVADFARQWLAPGPTPDVPMPARVSAIQLADTPGPVDTAVATILGKELEDDLRELPLDFFQQPPLPVVEWLLMVDGVDEVLDPTRRRKLLTRLAGAMGQGGPLRILITSRVLPEQELGFAAIGDASYELRPFDQRQLTELARKLFEVRGVTDPLAEARRFVQQLRASSLYDLCRTPLLAKMTWTVYVDHPEQRLPSGRTALYAQFVDRLLHAKEKKIAVRDQLRMMLRHCPDGEAVADRLVGQRRQLLAKIAEAMHTNAPQPLLDVALANLATARPTSGVTDAEWRTLARTLVIQTGLVGMKGGQLVFTHQTFQEYFTAAGIAASTDPDDGTGRQRLESGIQSNMQSITLFLAGQWTVQGFDLSAGVTWLLTKGRKQLRLAARIVADGVPVSTECKELLVNKLISMPGQQNEADELLLQEIQPWLENTMLGKIIAVSTIDPLTRIKAMLSASRRPDFADVLDAVHAVVSDTDTTLTAQMEAAHELDSRGLRALALELTIARVGVPGRDAGDLLEIARTLYEFGETDRANTILLALLTGQECDVGTMINIVEELTEHDQERAAEWLARISGRPNNSAYNIYRCARVFADIGDTDAACQLLLTVLRRPDADLWDFSWSAEKLYELGFSDDAVTALTDCALDGRRPSADRLVAIENLRELVGIDELFTSALTGFLHDPSMQMATKARVASLLGVVDSGFDVVGTIVRFAESPGIETDRVNVAEQLLELKETAQAETLLRSILRGDDSDEAIKAASELVDLGHRDEAAAALRTILYSPRQPIGTRCDSLAVLADFQGNPDDVEEITKIATSAAYPVGMRLKAVRSLGNVHDARWALVQVRHWMMSREATISQRFAAAEYAMDIADHALQQQDEFFLNDPYVPLAIALDCLDRIPPARWNTAVRAAVAEVTGRNDLPRHLSQRASNAATKARHGVGHEAAIRTALDRSLPIEIRLEACGELDYVSDEQLVDQVTRELSEREDVTGKELQGIAELWIKEANGRADWTCAATSRARQAPSFE